MSLAIGDGGKPWMLGVMQVVRLGGREEYPLDTPAQKDLAQEIVLAGTEGGEDIGQRLAHVLHGRGAGMDGTEHVDQHDSRSLLVWDQRMTQAFGFKDGRRVFLQA